MMKAYHAGLAIVMLSAAATARANMLVNGSLETTLPLNSVNLVQASPTVNSDALEGWSITGGTIDVVPDLRFNSSEGVYSVDMTGTPGLGTITQTVATLADTEYLLTFDLSVNPERGIPDEYAMVKGLRIEALGEDGESILAFQDYWDSAGTRWAHDMQYNQQTFQFTANGSQTTLRLSGLEPLNMPDGRTVETVVTGAVIDNLVLLPLDMGSNPVPEPASLVMLALGGALLLRRRARSHAVSGLR